MDIPNTGPTSLRSNLTDDNDDDDLLVPDEVILDKSKDAIDDRFVILTSAEELAQAKLIMPEK